MVVVKSGGRVRGTSTCCAERRTQRVRSKRHAPVMLSMALDVVLLLLRFCDGFTGLRRRLTWGCEQLQRRVW
ncbi:hypothetical protein BST61_g7351 [Cercospora zeina]